MTFQVVGHFQLSRSRKSLELIHNQFSCPKCNFPIDLPRMFVRVAEVRLALKDPAFVATLVKIRRSQLRQIKLVMEPLL